MTFSRPFRLYADSELTAAAKALESMIQGWAQDWLPQARPSALLLKDFGAEGFRLEQESAWVVYGGKALAQVLISKRSSVLKTIAAAIAGDAAQHEPPRLPLSPILSEVVEAALSSLAICVARRQEDMSLQVGSASDVLTATSVAGSGALCCEFSLGDGTLSLILNAELAAQYVPTNTRVSTKRPMLSSLSKAVASRQLSARLVLGHSDLALSELLQLDSGDVILLDRRVGQSFDLCTQDGRLLSEVQIGKKGSQVAASIIRKV